MNNRIILDKYLKLYLLLKNIIEESEKRILLDEADDLFMQNVNFFAKSYLISICSYMEAYLQEIAFDYAEMINSRLRNAEVPYNFIHWRLSKEVKKPQFSNIDLAVTKKDIADNLSANPYKVITLFKFFGVNLTLEDEFENNKDLVNTIVTKRNNIIHHNDKAMDISFSDLLAYIDVFIIYMKAIDRRVYQCNIPKSTVTST